MTELKEKVEESGYYASSGGVMDAQMKRAELELAQDGIYIWHYLSTYYGVDTKYRPNQLEEQKNEEPHWDSSQSLSSTDPSQRKIMPIQPSVEDHRRLFQILELNTSSQPSIKSIFSILKSKQNLESKANQMIEKKINDREKINSFWSEVRGYIGTIKDNLLHVADALILNSSSRKKFEKIKDMHNNEKIKVKNKEILPELLKYINSSFTLMCEIIISNLEEGLLKSTSINQPFLGELFSEDPFLKEEEIRKDTLKYLLKKYSQLIPSLHPESQNRNVRMFKANVVTANLYVKYEYEGKGNQYLWTEIDHNDKAAFSRSSFLGDQITEFDAHIQEHYGKLGEDNYLAKRRRRAVHDSEKALMMSLFGYNLRDETKKNNQTPIKEREEDDQTLIREGQEDYQIENRDLIDRIQPLVAKLKAKFDEKGVKENTSFTIEEIGLQFFSIREYCYWCESYLSHKFTELYENLKNSLRVYFPNISISAQTPEDAILKKFGSYSFVITDPNEQLGNNISNKDKFVIDRTNMKSYFSKQFLVDILKASDTISGRTRSYFVNDPKHLITEKQKEDYIKNVSQIVEKVNKKIKK